MTGMRSLSLALKVLPVLLELMVFKVLRARKVHAATPDHRVFRAVKVARVQKAMPVLRDHRESKVHLAIPVLLVRRVQPVRLVLPVPMALQVRKVSKAHVVCRAYKETPALLEPMVRKGPEVSKV